MARSRAPGLRATLTATTVALALLALAASTSLVVVTSAFHRLSGSLAAAVESVRIAEESEISLLLHPGGASREARAGLESELRLNLERAATFVTSVEEGEAVRRAREEVERYFASAAAGPAAEAEARRRAYEALERLVDINLDQARESHEDAARWDRLANRLGVTTGALLFALAAGLVWWLRKRAFEPVLALADSIERFARGDREARAPETGPLELRDMARRFNDMAGTLQERRRAQIAFLGGVAHDLANPLAALRMSILLMPPDRPLPQEPAIRQTLALLLRQIARLERMLGDFMDMAKIEAGALELRLDEVDARRVVHDVVGLFAATLAHRRLAVRVPDEPVVLRCDPLRLEQVLTNLISNAVKYSPEAAPVEVGLEPGEGEAVLWVSDRGVGIAEEDQRRLFEPFRRLGLSGEAVPGVGLGLSVVRSIVRAHGGSIEVHSAVGAGTTFRVRLPMSRSGPVAPALRVARSR